MTFEISAGSSVTSLANGESDCEYTMLCGSNAQVQSLLSDPIRDLIENGIPLWLKGPGGTVVFGRKPNGVFREVISPLALIRDFDSVFDCSVSDCNEAPDGAPELVAVFIVARRTWFEYGLVVDALTQSGNEFERISDSAIHEARMFYNASPGTVEQRIATAIEALADQHAVSWGTDMSPLNFVEHVFVSGTYTTTDVDIAAIIERFPETLERQQRIAIVIHLFTGIELDDDHTIYLSFDGRYREMRVGQGACAHAPPSPSPVQSNPICQRILDQFNHALETFEC